MQRSLWPIGLFFVVGFASFEGCVIPINPPTETGDDGGTIGDGGPTVDARLPDGAPIGDDGGDAAPPGAWTSATANLAGLPSECGNMSWMSVKPDEDLIIAGIAQKGLWGSRDGAKTWAALSTAVDGGPPLTNRMSAIVYDPQTTTRFWESGLYNAGAGYVTTDDGVTFTQLGTPSNSDGISVDFTDPNRKTLLLGGHEQAQVMWRSTNGGQTWDPVGATFPASTNCTHPLVIDGQTHLVGCGGFGGGPSGILRTTDGGQTWTTVTGLGGDHAPLVASDGSIYWSSPDDKGIARSTDKGVTWTDAVTAGYAVGSFAPIELPDGRIATIGSTAGGNPNLYVSADHGATWKQASAQLPWHDVVGLVYSPPHKAFFVWHFTCPGGGSVPVPDDAIMTFPFDYQTE